MKVFISADIEGVSGVVHSEHTARNGREHDYARLLLTEEVNACITGVIEAGATEIVVNDAHGTMRNIYHEKLHSKAELILGSPKKLAMMEGIDKTYDAAFFIGYHTMMGKSGILNHTFHGGVVRSVRINSIEVGEFGLNALIAGAFNVPVVFTSGCNFLKEEASALIPSIYTAVVKESINRTTAKNLHPVRARDKIQELSKEALLHANSVAPFQIEGPYHFDMQFLNTGLADAAEILPFVKRRDPLTVYFEVDNLLDGYRMVRSLIMIGNSTLSS